MDRLDWKIIAALETDGRQSYAELGEQIGLSKSPCWSRVSDEATPQTLIVPSS